MIPIFRHKPPSRLWVPLWMAITLVTLPFAFAWVGLVWWWRWARLTQLQAYRRERRVYRRLGYKMGAAIVLLTIAVFVLILVDICMK